MIRFLDTTVDPDPHSVNAPQHNRNRNDLLSGELPDPLEQLHGCRVSNLPEASHLAVKNLVEQSSYFRAKLGIPIPFGTPTNPVVPAINDFPAILQQMCNRYILQFCKGIIQ